MSADPTPPAASRDGDLAVARRVLGIEAAALTALGAALDASFDRAVDVLIAAKGRVIVSGMGKSGHVGAKIAATFASTGTPAQFVHPAEASHGDLGMIGAGDVVLMLSNSGETRELADMREARAQLAAGMESLEIRGGEAAGFEQGDGKRVADGKLHHGRCGRRQPVRAGFLLLRQKQDRVGLAAER